MSFEDSDLTPDICLHSDIDELPDGGVCNICMSIRFKQECPFSQEIELPMPEPLDNDLEDIKTSY